MAYVLTGLGATAAAEQSAGGEACSTVQAGVPENVCIRTAGHDGPHVAHDGAEHLQFEG